MKIVVCVKLVPATTADIRVAPDGMSLLLNGLETIISPYDEYALEAALQFRTAVPGSTVQVITVGSDESLKCLQHAFSVGVDSALHIKGSLDARCAANAVAAALKDAAPDLVLCGRQAIDDDQWLFTGALAERLNFAHVTATCALVLSADQKGFQCRRRVEGGEQVIDVRLPAVISCDKGLNEPRVPTLKGRLDAKKKQPVAKTPADLGLQASDLEPALKVLKCSPPPQKTPGKTISMEARQAAVELVRLLREEAKVI
ncbi:MAG TPA: electron transfer flavoprotein subunit beta/FixA family protein [Planctomycetota bacterium]|jgi:electron transfer flavoprotein beta subunit